MNAPSFSQRVMDVVIQDLSFVRAYIKDFAAFCNGTRDVIRDDWARGPTNIQHFSDKEPLGCQFGWHHAITTT